MVDTDDVPVETPPEGGAPEAKKKKRLPLPALLGIVVAAQIGLSFLVLTVRVAPAMKPAPAEESAEAAGHGSGGGGGHGGGGGKHGEGGGILELEPMVMNLAALEGERPSFAKLGIALESSGAGKEGAGLEGRMPIIRDCIITTVSSRTLDDVTNPDGKERLRRELLEALRERLGASSVSNVYFTNFVIQ